MGSPSPSHSPSPEAGRLIGGKGDGKGKKGAELEAPSANAVSPETVHGEEAQVPDGSEGEDLVSRNIVSDLDGAADGDATSKVHQGQQ